LHTDITSVVVSYLTSAHRGTSHIRSALLCQLVVQIALICFNIGSNGVQPVCVTKDLGVHVCSDLSFATYVNTIAAKAHARACLINKCFISRDTVTLTRAFVTYVRPILEYASVIWSPYHINQISKLESVQRDLQNELQDCVTCHMLKD